jgi:hypothetical protein
MAPKTFDATTPAITRLPESSKSWLHPSSSSWFETAFGLLTMRPRVFNDLILMVSLSNHEQHRFSAAC